MISYPHRCIFIHIPKNGGASIERLIWSEKERTVDNLWMGMISSQRNKYQTGALQHLFARNVMKEVGEDVYNDYFTFSMVRNPWDRVVSQYIYLFKRPSLQAFLGADHKTSFPEYLELIARKPHVHWQPQYLFLTDDAGSSIVDYIGRFEDFETSIKEMMIRICGEPKRPNGDPLNIPHVNKSKRVGYWMYYDDETRNAVAELYKEDILRYEYTFNESAYRTRSKQLPFPVSRENPDSLTRRLVRKVKKKFSW